MSSGFVSANDIDDERTKRQEEWERVRKPEDPVTAPEPEVCNKTLYEQLRDNKEVKDAEFAEAKKFKNMIRGIDEDESDFLSKVDVMKAEMVKQKKKEEEDLLKQMAQAKNQVLDETTSSVPSLLPPVPKPTSSSKSKQASLLSMAIKRKSDNGESPKPTKVAKEEQVKPATSAMNVIGVIPGIGSYDGSSDSASSDSSDDEAIAVLPLLQTSQPEKKAPCNNE